MSSDWSCVFVFKKGFDRSHFAELIKVLNIKEQFVKKGYIKQTPFDLESGLAREIIHSGYKGTSLYAFLPISVKDLDLKSKADPINETYTIEETIKFYNGGWISRDRKTAYLGLVLDIKIKNKEFIVELNSWHSGLTDFIVNHFAVGKSLIKVCKKLKPDVAFIHIHGSVTSPWFVFFTARHGVLVNIAKHRLLGRSVDADFVLKKMYGLSLKRRDWEEASALGPLVPVKKFL